MSEDELKEHFPAEWAEIQRRNAELEEMRLTREKMDAERTEMYRQEFASWPWHKRAVATVRYLAVYALWRLLAPLRRKESA